jgi:hypothetical protein
MLKCPQCGTDAVRRIRQGGAAERLLSLLSRYSFRCQLCGHGFRAFSRAPLPKTERRQYDRLPAEVRATVMGKAWHGDDLVTNLSMGGCSLKTNAPLAAGALLHLGLQPSDREGPIMIQTVIVRSVRADSLGLEFLDFEPRQKRYLSRFIRYLLMGNSPSRESEPRLSGSMRA